MPLFARQPDTAAFVLLVEDEPGIREIIRRFLEQQGYRVRAAASVPEALPSVGPQLRAAILDVILVNSGGRSGIDVLMAIRGLEKGDSVPVLMLTGYGLNAEVQESIASYGAELLHKPVSLIALADWLEKVSHAEDDET